MGAGIRLSRLITRTRTVVYGGRIIGFKRRKTRKRG
jgi:hypothetical protein